MEASKGSSYWEKVFRLLLLFRMISSIIMCLDLFCLDYSIVIWIYLLILRSRLGESQTLQQFSRDADEMENWIAEKLQLATEESYKVIIKSKQPNFVVFLFNFEQWLRISYILYYLMMVTSNYNLSFNIDFLWSEKRNEWSSN